MESIMKKWHKILILALVSLSLTSCIGKVTVTAEIDGMNLMGYWAVTEDSRYENVANVRSYWWFNDEGNLFYYESQSPLGSPFSNGVLDTTGNKFDCIFAVGFDLTGRDLYLMNGLEAVKYGTIAVTSSDSYTFTVTGDNGYVQTCERIRTIK